MHRLRREATHVLPQHHEVVDLEQRQVGRLHRQPPMQLLRLGHHPGPVRRPVEFHQLLPQPVGLADQIAQIGSRIDGHDGPPVDHRFRQNSHAVDEVVLGVGSFLIRDQFHGDAHFLPTPNQRLGCGPFGDGWRGDHPQFWDDMVFGIELVTGGHRHGKRRRQVVQQRASLQTVAVALPGKRRLDQATMLGGCVAEDDIPQQRVAIDGIGQSPAQFAALSRRAVGVEQHEVRRRHRIRQDEEILDHRLIGLQPPHVPVGQRRGHRDFASQQGLHHAVVAGVFVFDHFRGVVGRESGGLQAGSAEDRLLRFVLFEPEPGAPYIVLQRRGGEYPREDGLDARGHALECDRELGGRLQLDRADQPR